MTQRDRSPVARVTVYMGDVQREYTSCWIQVDYQSLMVHIWPAQRDVRPAVSAPIQSVIIDWRLVEPEPLAPPCA